MKKIAILFLLAALLAGCENLPKQFGKDFQNSKIENGTSVASVEQKYGTPQRVETSRASTSTPELIYYYLYQGPIDNGKFLYKELIVVFVDGKSIKQNYLEKIILKPEKESKFSNHGIQLD